MKEFLSNLSGRKFVLVFVAIILLALKGVLAIDDETIDKILYLALGGTGALAIEDSVKAAKKRT